jgi:hypothetical protein
MLLGGRGYIVVPILQVRVIMPENTPLIAEAQNIRRAAEILLKAAAELETRAHQAALCTNPTQHSFCSANREPRPANTDRIRELNG